ncbi:MAG: chemotaxis protein CheB [Salibacteraceae bacterium]
MISRPTPYKAIVIGGSAGSFPVITKVLSSLKTPYRIPLILCLHRLKHVRSGFVEALSIKSNIKVVEPFDKQTIKPGFAYLAPANYHLSIELGNHFSLSTEEMVSYSRPSIDITFESCGFAYKQKLLGVILSGANKDGAHGIRKVKAYGGTTLVQDPMESKVATMPTAAIESHKPNHIYSSQKIIDFLNLINR